MISVREVIHWLVLFVDDAYTSFVRTDCYGFDIFNGFTLLFEVGMDEFGSFDSSLGVKFSCTYMSASRTNPHDAEGLSTWV